MPMQEYQEGAQNLVISDTELKQVVYAFKCNKSMLQVKGKLNTITLGMNKSGCRIFRGSDSLGRLLSSHSSWGVTGVRFDVEKMLHEVKETWVVSVFMKTGSVVIKL